MKTIGIISLSNPLNQEKRHLIEKIKEKFKKYEIKIFESKAVYKENTTSPAFKAEELMNLYKNAEVEMIFDVSGGDLANTVLSHLDFKVIEENPKPFFGFSDLSVIMNSIFKKTGRESFWFQLRSIAQDDTDTSLKLLADFILNKNDALLNFKYKFLQGNKMTGTVVGGNLRCTLKSAGTEYMPDLKNNLLLIESLGGDINKITTYLTQYKLMGAFEECSGVILGTFTELEKTMSESEVCRLILDIIDNKNLPVIKTSEIGHHCLSKSIALGRHYTFN